ncbi:MAG: hypothetical protein RR573_02130 [Oscillospiraceae bacterium]
MSRNERGYAMECCMRGLPVTSVGLMIYTEWHKKAPTRVSRTNEQNVKGLYPLSIAQLKNLSIQKDD